MDSPGRLGCYGASEGPALECGLHCHLQDSFSGGSLPLLLPLGCKDGTISLLLLLLLIIIIIFFSFFLSSSSSSCEPCPLAVCGDGCLVRPSGCRLAVVVEAGSEEDLLGAGQCLCGQNSTT